MLSPLNDIASLGMQLPPLSLPHSLSPLKHSTNRRNISRPLLPGSVRSNQTYAPLSRSIDRSPGRRARCDEMVSAADAVIPACAAVGIAFAVWHWLLVSRVKVSPYSAAAAAARNGGAGRAVFRPEGEVDDDDGGCGDDEEADGDGGVAAMARCAEIQSAIRVGEFRSISLSVC